MGREMELLKRMLKEANIPYTIEKDFFGNDQIWYPSRENVICDVICNMASYGYSEGLLEMMGLLTPEEEEYDSVIGWMTSIDVFTRISDHYIQNQKNQSNATPNNNIECPSNDWMCPYFDNGGCTLENAKMECDAFYGLEED